MSWLSTEETKPNIKKANDTGTKWQKTHKKQTYAQLSYTLQHRTVVTIFPLILWTITIAQTLSTGGEEAA